jgi:hypothetical protein
MLSQLYAVDSHVSTGEHCSLQATSRNGQSLARSGARSATPQLYTWSDRTTLHSFFGPEYA